MNLVMQFGNVEAEIEFFASLVKADGWLKGDNHIRTCFADNKRKKAGWVENQKQFTERCKWQGSGVWDGLAELYDSKVSLIPDEILKEELAPLSITLPNLLNTIDFYEKPRLVVSVANRAGDCGMFVLKYIELLSAELPLATCTSQNMPFFRLKLAAEITRGDAYMP
ncbi:hypothetical protein Prudu_005559 [Prunus dulcis]|uniref:Ubiquitin-like protease family profile domain-containing protein n=1 Tax=Prunus dulcis TaxID=3755 RepID=A0A4Y1QY28_PRUDU|nr:hypothetical protein Prudu_005559 [Prunus dulcis]